MFHQQHSLSVMLQKLKVVAVSKILWSFKNRLIKSLSNISNQKPLVKTTPLWFYYYSFHAHLNFSVLPNANNKFKFYLYNMGDNIMWSARRFILGSLLFIFFLNVLFLIIRQTEFVWYVDNNTTYPTSLNICNIIKSLENDYDKLHQWFLDNQQR